MNPARLAAIAIASIAASPAAADVRWDESIDGDLSSDNLSPTFLSFEAGSNSVFGTTTPLPDLDPDFFSFTVPDGLELSSVIFLEYGAPAGELSFFAVEEGGQITSTDDPSALLSALLIGVGPGLEPGDELLDDLQNPNVFGGFSGNLGPGTYTFWYQETASQTRYAFDFILTPTPGSAGILAGGLLMLRRRR